MPQKKTKTIYLDNAASTPTDIRVLAAMRPIFDKVFANPASLHTEGQKAEKELVRCRKDVAGFIGALPDNIIFTSGGTESDNLAIYGLAKAVSKSARPGHIITTAIEHSAILKPLEELQTYGWQVTYLQPSREGLVTADQVIKAIKPETVLISIGYANNEVGSIAPIAEIGRKILQYRKTNKTIYPFFHTDACQATQYLDLSVEKLHIDLMTLSGSKIYGPKGSGVLYVRRGVPISPMSVGGEQEMGLRAGTQNLPAIVGFTKALSLAMAEKEKRFKQATQLTKYFFEKIKKQIPDIELNGPEIGETRLPNNLNISFAGAEGDALLLYLSAKGIMCSTGSACSSRLQEASHVLKAMGRTYVEAKGALRFSVGHNNIRQEIDYVMKHLPAIVAQVRAMQKTK
jgi:cysteine desulfurase